jgi:hypothetical protein
MAQVGKLNAKLVYIFIMAVVGNFLINYNTSDGYYHWW